MPNESTLAHPATMTVPMGTSDRLLAPRRRRTIASTEKAIDMNQMTPENPITTL